VVFDMVKVYRDCMGRGLSFVSVDVCLEECTVVPQGLACPSGYVKWDYINTLMIVDCRITFLTDTGLLDQQICTCVVIATKLTCTNGGCRAGCSRYDFHVLLLLMPLPPPMMMIMICV
jgi:hypothetical protein